MVNFNRLAIMTVLAVSLVALCGVASATTAPAASVTIDKVQINGHYDGSMTLLNNVPGYYGYTYDLFIPDGTYTVFGTITNDDKNNAVDVWVGAIAGKAKYTAAGVKTPPVDVSKTYTVKKNSTTGYDLTLAADSAYDITVFWGIVGAEDFDYIDVTDDVDVVNQGDANEHTVDQGPMSNMVVIFSNGFTNSEMPLLFSANQSDINAIYPGNGHFNFGNSSLYSFLN